MPLPPEVLEELRAGIERAEASLKDIRDTIADLRAAGIDATRQEELYREAEANLRKLKIFYGRQIERGR